MAKFEAQNQRDTLPRVSQTGAIGPASRRQSAIQDLRSVVIFTMLSFSLALATLLALAPPVLLLLNRELSISTAQYLFLRVQQPIGFITGRAIGADGTTPHPRSLITSNTAPFADLTPATGRFIVAGRAGSDVVVSGIDAATHDAGTGGAHVDARDQIVPLDVTLAATAPTVTATNPSAHAINVPLDASVSIDFSDAIDAASVTAGQTFAGGSGGCSSLPRMLDG